jgi:hypothetical protein
MMPRLLKSLLLRLLLPLLLSIPLPNSMTNQEAFQVLVSAAQEFRGTAKDHAVIVEAAKTIQEAIKPAQTEPEAVAATD